MKCVKCHSKATKVLESRDSAGDDAVRRRRECLSKGCKERFTTYERVEKPTLMVVKKDGIREKYDRDKVLNGIRLCTEKTRVTAQELETIIANIEDKLYSENKEEVPSTMIGQYIMDELARVDQVAYVRFASVYRNFKDISQFEQELKVIRNKDLKL